MGAWRRATGRDAGTAWWLSLAGAASVILALASRGLGLAPACVWHGLTGIPCPTCGSTRMLEACAQGHLFEAFAWNPLCFLGLVGFLVAGALAPAWIAWRLPVRASGVPLPPRLRWILGVLVLANWIYLIARVGRPV